MKKQELKQCPFCGGKASVEKEKFMDRIMFSIGCRKDGYCPGSAASRHLFVEEFIQTAIDRWNKRK